MKSYDEINPGEFRFGGGHVIEKLVAGEKVQLFGLSYGTDDYPGREIRTWFTMGQLSPLHNDPLYETIGIETRVWPAGAPGSCLRRGHSACLRLQDN